MSLPLVRCFSREEGQLYRASVRRLRSMSLSCSLALASGSTVYQPWPCWRWFSEPISRHKSIVAGISSQSPEIMTVHPVQVATQATKVRLPTGTAAVDLFWLPLGAGGHYVKFNGRVYERFHAFFERRQARDLYHSALQVTVPESRFVIENAWPIPKATGVSRGVTVEGPVGSPYLGRFRTLRYEVRVWREGIIADVDEAVASPQRLSNDEAQARRVLEQASHVPAFVWGRD
jgi:hypothetical protein